MESELAWVSGGHINVVLTIHCMQDPENAGSALGHPDPWVVCLGSLTKGSAQACPELILNEQSHM